MDTVKLIDDGSDLIINVSNATVIEFDGIINFNITLSRALDEDLTLSVAPFMLNVKNGSGVKRTASYDDFTEIPSSVTIPKGQTSTTYTMTINDNTELEDTEDFLLYFTPNESDRRKYGLKDEYTTRGIILDDDSVVYVTIEDKTLQEGGEECILDKISVTLSRELKDNETISVNFGNQTLEFNASSGTTLYYDFEHNGDLIVNAQKITTQILNPSISYENVKAQLIKEGIITIQDDDTPIYVTITGNSTSEASEKLHATAKLSRNLKDGECVCVRISGQDIEFAKGITSQNFIVCEWSDDKVGEENSKFYTYPSWVSSNSTVYFKGKGGKCVIIDEIAKFINLNLLVA